MSDHDPADADLHRRLDALPSIDEDPVVWDPQRGEFVQGERPVPRWRGATGATPAVPPPPGGAPSVDPTQAMGRPPTPPAPPSVAGGATRPRHVVIGPADGAGAAPAPPPASPVGAPRPAAAGRPVGPPPVVGPARPGAAPGRPPAPPRRSRKAAKAAKAAGAARAGTGAAVGAGRTVARTGRKTATRIVLLCLSLPVLLLLAGFAFGWWKFGSIPRAEVAAVLSPPAGAGRNILVVGTDSRDGINPDDPNAGAFLGEKVSGARTDTIMVLRSEGDHQTLLSIPRDLWVKDPRTGEMGRINATFNAGPANLVRAVQGLGIPVHDYVEINFVSFGKLVDAVGGIDVDFPFPARDKNSGLQIDTAGVHHLDGTQALAYVRSRHYEELKGGKWVTDPSSDLGRVQRQRTFLTSLLGEVTATRNPMELSNVTSAFSVGMKLDDRMGYLDALRLGWQLKGFHPDSVTLPVNGRTTSGGADVLDLKQPDAKQVLAGFA